MVSWVRRRSLYWDLEVQILLLNFYWIWRKYNVSHVKQIRRSCTTLCFRFQSWWSRCRCPEDQNLLHQLESHSLLTTLGAKMLIPFVLMYSVCHLLHASCQLMSTAYHLLHCSTTTSTGALPTPRLVAWHLISVRRLTTVKVKIQTLPPLMDLFQRNGFISGTLIDTNNGFININLYISISFSFPLAATPRTSSCALARTPTWL